MSTVKVVARIRPLLKNEIDPDRILEATSSSTDQSQQQQQQEERQGPLDTVKIPNPKNAGEKFGFQFQAVYDEEGTQQEIFEKEVSPTIKPLFIAPHGHALTLFAYGSTGTGKTFTMRGGKSLPSRGMIPRMLSSIYRRAKKMEKDDTTGETIVEVSMSYYEIYNDKVFDLLDDAVDKRPPAGLPVREVEGGRTVVVGLFEESIATLKDFEELYDRGNGNRRTGATKLNAASSRSHAVLCVKISINTAEGTRVSTASAIDLAGSEDNRRTGNGKEALVESASINKSLFVLAQCVEAISKKQARIPYRESKMTRILSLGQNGGTTVMILNLAPTRAYHLDTVSSLNFANRTKKIEIREAENEIMFKGPPRAPIGSALGLSGTAIQRQPLRPLATSVNVNAGISSKDEKKKANDKSAKAFSVYSDRAKTRTSNSHPSVSSRVLDTTKKSSPLKRGSGSFGSQPSSRPTKMIRPNTTTFSTGVRQTQQLSKASIEEMVEKKVSELLASRALETNKTEPPPKEISEEVQRRLESIEQRLEGQEDSRAEGLSYLLMAKQHQARGEDSSALKMYQLALPYFPGNAKLAKKIEATKSRLQSKKAEALPPHSAPIQQEYMRPEKLTSKPLLPPTKVSGRRSHEADDNEYIPSPALIYNHHSNSYDARDDDEDDEDPSFLYKKRKINPKKQTITKKHIIPLSLPTDDPNPEDNNNVTGNSTPRTSHVLSVINTRDVSRIKLLKGVGVKKAEMIVRGLMDLDDEDELGFDFGDGKVRVKSLSELEGLRGVGGKCVLGMRMGVEV